MRKNYIAPNVVVVVLSQQESLLAGSGEVGVGLRSGRADEDAEVLSRRGSAFWEDE